MKGEYNKRKRNEPLLGWSVNKCFDGYQRLNVHSWQAKQSMDLAKLHSLSHQKRNKNSKNLIFKTNEQNNCERRKQYLIKNLVLNFKQLRNDQKCWRKETFSNSIIEIRSVKKKELRKFPPIHFNTFFDFNFQKW